jgi:hypothetical protein
MSDIDTVLPPGLRGCAIVRWKPVLGRPDIIVGAILYFPGGYLFRRPRPTEEVHSLAETPEAVPVESVVIPPLEGSQVVTVDQLHFDRLVDEGLRMLWAGTRDELVAHLATVGLVLSERGAIEWAL